MGSLYAVFCEADITPEPGTCLSGWITPLRPAEVVRDPVMAHIGILSEDFGSLAIISLDILSISAADSDDLRNRVETTCGIPFDAVMIAATHSHTGPAVANLPATPSDRAYVEKMKEAVVLAAARAVKQLVPARLGGTSGFEGRLSFNRRYIRKDGIVRTHPVPADPGMLCAEGPVDTQLGVLCVRNMTGKAMGYFINFACHPCYYGGLRIVTANYPGSISRYIKLHEGPQCVSVFLNGACGDVHHDNPVNPDSGTDMETMGYILANSAFELALRAEYSSKIQIGTAIQKIKLPLRVLTPHMLAQSRMQLEGGAAELDPRWQRFGPDEVYAASILELDERIRKSPFTEISIQALKIGETALAAIPAELFAWLGIRIKTESRIKPVYVVSCANGMVGYAATKDAYSRGGYEVTPCIWSKLEPGAGETIVEAALEAIHALQHKGGI